MDALDFEDVARLLNHSRSTTIDIASGEGRQGRWQVYTGSHRVHTSTYPFYVLYITARATTDDMNEAAAAVRSIDPLHVVYAPSLDRKHRKHRQLFGKSAASFHTTRDYLATFISDEAAKFRERVLAQAPAYYVDPRVEVPAGSSRRVPNPVLDLLLEDEESRSKRGALIIVLAEAGQGKSYLSRHMAAEIARRRKELIPLLVESVQWSGIPAADLASLPKTIVHAFGYHDAPIGWAAGCEDEFLRVAFKADLCRLLFDGFDEYVLRNSETVNPFEVLESLSALARETQARIVITSRTSFWDTGLPHAERDEFVERSGADVYRIRPFDANHARNYFAQRLDEPGVQRAAAVFHDLVRVDSELAGRGFVVSLIADLVLRSAETAVMGPHEKANAVVWLIHQLCQREQLRQQLALSADDQFRLFRDVAADIARGGRYTSELVRLELEMRELSDRECRQHVEKLKSHPLLTYDPAGDSWSFAQEQVYTALLAEELRLTNQTKLLRLIEGLTLSPPQLHDLASTIVDLVRKEIGSGTPVAEIGRLISVLSGPSDGTSQPAAAARRLAALLALVAVDRMLPKGSLRSDRTDLLRRVGGRECVEGLTFGGTIAAFDFRGQGFHRCVFDSVTWANCVFDAESKFVRCEFIGGNVANCTGFGLVQTVDCQFDQNAAALLDHERVNAGQRGYTADDLQRDLGLVLRKFIGKSGSVVRTVQHRNLRTGPIGSSQYREDIIRALENHILHEHVVSGTTEKALHVREDAVEALRFFADNNVLSGPLCDVHEKLMKRLNIR